MENNNPGNNPGYNPTLHFSLPRIVLFRIIVHSSTLTTKRYAYIIDILCIPVIQSESSQTNFDKIFVLSIKIRKA